MTVKKTNGSYEEFDKEKVKDGICEAFKSCNEECVDGVLNSIIDNLYIYDKIESKEIRRQIEEALMSVNKKVAKAYIQKFISNEELKERVSFNESYINAKNASSGSKYDSNANVSNKNIATLNAEIPKKGNIQFNRYNTTNKIKNLYSKKLADQYIKDLENHIIYKHDESTFGINSPYCVAIQSLTFLNDGLKGLGGLSAAPKNLDSFCGMFVNLIFAVSSQFAGAVACSGFFVMFDYFARKEWGDDYYLHTDRPTHIRYNTDGTIKEELTIDKQIEQYFQEVVYGINQPAAARGFQSAFTNFAYFDKPYFEGIYGAYRFPDGSSPKWESLSYLQKKFMKWFNKERTKTMLTFPVETMSLLYKDNHFIDQDYADFTAEMYSEGHSFFTYISDSPDTLSSCCFKDDQKVLWKSSDLGVQLTTLKELYDMKWDGNKKNLRIYHNGSWIEGKPISLPNRQIYKVVTDNNKELYMTDNHINVTLNGEKRAEELTTHDYLMFNTQGLNAVPENNENLTYEQGFVIGAFLGDGSFGSKSDNGIIYEINFSQNVNKYEKMMDIIDAANKQLGGKNASILRKVYNNVYPVTISSKELASFIIRWTNWERGTYAWNKELNLNCLLQSEDFRKGILDGWYNTDGGNSNRCYTTSPKLAECMEVLITSLGMQSIINISDRTDEPCIIREVEYTRNYPLYCVRWYSNTNQRKNRSNSVIWKKHNNSIFFKIKSIEKIDYDGKVYCIECKNEEEPYFTLPNGVITHNCRLSNKIQENTFSFTNGLTGEQTGSKSVITLNYNRIIQNFVKEEYNGDRNAWKNNRDEFEEKFKAYLIPILERIYKYHTAYNEILWDLYNANMLPVYTAGFINLNRQYLTLGINGLNEAYMYLGGECRYCDDYIEFCKMITGTMKEQNTLHRTKKTMYNSEFVPAESLGIKNYKWDKKDGYWVPEGRNCYTSYFFLPDDPNISILEKMKLHGNEFVGSCDGGSACHLNLNEHLSYQQYKDLLKFAGENGTNYFTFNVKNSECRDCGYISKHTIDKCPICGRDHISYWTRIIGYLRRVEDFNEGRQIEEGQRIYSE